MLHKFVLCIGFIVSCFGATQDYTLAVQNLTQAKKIYPNESSKRPFVVLNTTGRVLQLRVQAFVNSLTWRCVECNALINKNGVDTVRGDGYKDMFEAEQCYVLSPESDDAAQWFDLKKAMYIKPCSDSILPHSCCDCIASEASGDYSMQELLARAYALDGIRFRLRLFNTSNEFVTQSSFDDIADAPLVVRGGCGTTSIQQLSSGCTLL